MNTIVTKPLFCLLLIMFSLFGCFKKKTSKISLDGWLEANFPGQFEVLDRNRNYDIADWISSGKKIAVLADKSDKDVQFTLEWHKNSPDLGLNKANLLAKLESCRADAARARILYSLLMIQGLERFSVGTIEDAAYVLVFDEPTPELRLKILESVLSATRSTEVEWPSKTWIEVLEPDAFHTEFQDIVPEAHWSRPGTWHDSQKIMSIHFNLAQQPDATALSNQWQIHIASNRCSRLKDKAYPVAKAWADQYLKMPFYLEPNQLVRYGKDPKNTMAFQFDFPWYKKEADAANGLEPQGYVQGNFQFDTQEFTGIKQIGPQ